MDIWLERVGEEVILFGRYTSREEPRIQAVFKGWYMAFRVFPKARTHESY